MITIIYGLESRHSFGMQIWACQSTLSSSKDSNIWNKYSFRDHRNY